MKLILSIFVGIGFLGCVAKKDIEQEVKKAMEANPQFLIDAIKKNPIDFLEAMSNLSTPEIRKELQARQAEKQFAEEFSSPKRPKIRPDETIRGTKNAPLVLVEYSDFKCPYCSRGFDTVRALLDKYEGKIQFIYKHFPIYAMEASRYYEGIRLQDEQKAFKFHDEIFANQSKLKRGEPFLKSLAKKLKVDMKRLAKDVKSSAVQKRIDEDMQEASKFGFQGTPGFLINGISVRGALPPEHFEKIISKLVEKGSVQL